MNTKSVAHSQQSQPGSGSSSVLSRLGNLLQRLAPCHGHKQRIRELESALDQETKRNAEIEVRNRSLSQSAELINFAPVALFWKDLEGVFLGCNQIFAKNLGHKDPGDIIGKSDCDFWPPEDSEKFRAQDQSVIRTGQPSVDIIQSSSKRESGSVWIKTTRCPLFDSQGRVRGILGTFEDVTESRRGESALKDSESCYRSLFQSMHDAFALHELICDPQGKPCDYRYIDVNPAFESLNGIARSQCIGRTAREVFANLEQSWIERFGEVALTGKMTSYENYSRDLNRHYAVTVYCPRPGQFAVISEDITRHKQAEETERAARQRVALLVNQSPVAVIEWDLEFEVTEWNAAAERIFGYTRAEALGKKALDLIALPKDRELLKQVFNDLVACHGGTESINENITRDGRVIVCSWRNTPLVDEKGKTIGAASLAQDITESVHAESRRKKLENQMQQVQKLESLGVLAGGIAHDFNNMLMSILGNADLALAELPEMSPGRSHIREIETASRRAADLCRQMLAYSGKGDFVIESVILSDLVGEMVHLLKTSISKKAILNLNLEKNLPTFKGDVTQVRQIVMNLVINASEAIGERSGVITISTGAMECSPEYLREVYSDSTLTPGFYVWLEVCDTGCGMDIATQHRIFEPFFTTKFSGRGLGLAAALGIVRGHKGAIKIYSELGKGTTFKILFPASEEDATARKSSAAAAGQWKGSGTLLLVDDEETIRATGKMMLERMGYKVLIAEDGRQALELYSRHKEKVILILLDLTMPHLNGEETFRELRQVNPQVRVVMSSGYSEADVSARFVGKGLAGFIQKPYTRAELSACLRNVLGTPEDA